MTKPANKEHRRYLRHPAQVPVVCRLEGHLEASKTELRDIGFGGMGFVSAVAYEPGDVVSMDYPTMDVEGLHGEVMWIQMLDDGSHRYSCGIKFMERLTFARARMVEQMCCIEVYQRKGHSRTRGRIGRNKAAQEWIESTAKHFPR